MMREDEVEEGVREKLMEKLDNCYRSTVWSRAKMP
jgi:hypothetical protein